MFTKQFLRTLSILLCKAHVEICFDIYSAAHLPTQSGGILNASIIQTRPNPPSATQQCSGQQPPLRSYSRRDRTLWSLPYPQKEVKSSFLCLFLSSKDPLTAVSLRCFYMFISKPLDALFRLSLSPMNRVAVGDTTELAKTDTHKPLRRECEKFPKISRGALM